MRPESDISHSTISSTKKNSMNLKQSDLYEFSVKFNVQIRNHEFRAGNAQGCLL